MEWGPGVVALHLVALLRGYLQHLLHGPLSRRRLMMATPRRMLVLSVTVVVFICVCMRVHVRVMVVLCVCVRMMEVCFIGGLVAILVAFGMVLNVRNVIVVLGVQKMLLHARMPNLHAWRGHHN